MDHIDETAVRCLRDSARRLLWLKPEWGERFEDDAVAQQFISDDLRRSIRDDIADVGNFEAAFEIADNIILGFINSNLVTLEKRPQTFAAKPAPPTTGAPGRPSNMHLIEKEFCRRGEGGNTEETLAEETRVLVAWFTGEHPDKDCPTGGTIQNKIRVPYKRWHPKKATIL